MAGLHRHAQGTAPHGLDSAWKMRKERQRTAACILTNRVKSLEALLCKHGIQIPVETVGSRSAEAPGNIQVNSLRSQPTERGQPADPTLTAKVEDLQHKLGKHMWTLRQYEGQVAKLRHLVMQLNEKVWHLQVPAASELRGASSRELLEMRGNELSQAAVSPGGAEKSVSAVGMSDDRPGSGTMSSVGTGQGEQMTAAMQFYIGEPDKQSTEAETDEKNSRADYKQMLKDSAAKRTMDPKADFAASLANMQSEQSVPFCGDVERACPVGVQSPGGLQLQEYVVVMQDSDKVTEGRKKFNASTLGVYKLSGTHHGRPMSQREADAGISMPACLYYWEDKGNAKWRNGWWIATCCNWKFEGHLLYERAWAHCKDDSMTPPESNWQHNWDKTDDEGPAYLLVLPRHMSNE